MRKFSPQVIVFLADAITGGPAVPGITNPWPYRRGWEIMRFFKECGYKFEIGQSSRVPWTELSLEAINENDGVNGLVKIIERLTDPRDWIDDKGRLKRLVIALNKLLFYDGYEIAFSKKQDRFLLRERNIISPIIKEVSKKEFLSPEFIRKDFSRALTNINSDPADSITSSCSFVESVCKHILDKLGRLYPNKQTIHALTKEVLRFLALSPKNIDDQDFKKLTGSLCGVAQAIGSLRTKFGDAHGHTESRVVIKPIHAKLVVGAASTLALFLTEVLEVQPHFKKIESNRIKRLVKEYHRTIIDEDPSDPLPYKRCPNCGSDKLSRSFFTFPDSQERLFTIECKECKWQINSEV